jgi:hypothetical protein
VVTAAGQAFCLPNGSARDIDPYQGNTRSVRPLVKSREAPAAAEVPSRCCAPAAVEPTRVAAAKGRSRGPLMEKSGRFECVSLMLPNICMLHVGLAKNYWGHPTDSRAWSYRFQGSLWKSRLGNVILFSTFGRARTQQITIGSNESRWRCRHQWIGRVARLGPSCQAYSRALVCL